MDNGSLLKACRIGDVERAALMISGGADVNQTNDDGCTPLFIASWYGRTKVVEKLLEAGADVNQATNNGMTPLIIASWKGHTEVVEKLLEAGADVNQADNHGWTPLYNASRFGRKEVAEILLRGGADPSVRTNAPLLEKHLRLPVYTMRHSDGNPLKGSLPDEDRILDLILPRRG